MTSRWTSLALLGGILVAIGLIWARARHQQDESRGLGDSFEYDLSELTTVDPALLTWREDDPIFADFDTLRAVAVGPDDSIVVAGDRGVIRLDSAGRGTGTIDLGAEPTCVAVNADGTIYVGLRDHVRVYTSVENKPAVWPTLGARATLTSIAVAENSVYVADAGNRIVIRYDRSGRELNRIGAKDIKRGIRGFVVPSPYFDLAADENAVWVVDPGRHALMKFRANGDLITAWAKSKMTIEGFCGCCNPTHIALLENGSFVTSEKGLVRVKVHRPDGELDSVVAGPLDFEEGVVGLDLAIDSRGRLLVLDPKAGMVRVFVRKNKS